MSDITADESRHDATQRDELHTMTVRELEAIIVAAGILISHRQILRHCKAGTFDAKKLPATNNVEEWFIAPGSVDKGIADIKTLQEHRARRDATRPVTTEPGALERTGNFDSDGSSHDALRRVMTGGETIVDKVSQRQDEARPGPTGPDMVRQVAVGEAPTSRYVALLERDNEFLRDQVAKKDDQIQDLSKRFGETQSLLGAMQRMFAPLLGQGDPYQSRKATEQNPEAYQTSENSAPVK
jgi:hypothetical protein